MKASQQSVGTWKTRPDGASIPSHWQGSRTRSASAGIVFNFKLKLEAWSSISYHNHRRDDERSMKPDSEDKRNDSDYHLLNSRKTKLGEATQVVDYSLISLTCFKADGGRWIRVRESEAHRASPQILLRPVLLDILTQIESKATVYLFRLLFLWALPQAKQFRDSKTSALRPLYDLIIKIFWQSGN